MKGKIKYLITGGLFLMAITAITVYKYLYQEHRVIAEEKVDYKIAALDLNSVMNRGLEPIKYADKVIQTYGKITAIEQQSIIIDDHVQVSFLDALSSTLQVDDSVNIKGRCIGYDDLLELVKIDQAITIDSKEQSE